MPKFKNSNATFWVDKSSLKMPKLFQFWRFPEILKLVSNSVTRQVTFNWTKIDQKFKCDILRRQKFIENTKNVLILQPEACGQTVLPDRSLLKWQKSSQKRQHSKVQIRHLQDFSNNMPFWQVLIIQQCYQTGPF